MDIGEGDLDVLHVHSNPCLHISHQFVAVGDARTIPKRISVQEHVPEDESSVYSSKQIRTERLFWRKRASTRKRGPDTRWAKVRFQIPTDSPDQAGTGISANIADRPASVEAKVGFEAKRQLRPVKERCTLGDQLDARLITQLRIPSTRQLLLDKVMPVGLDEFPECGRANNANIQLEDILNMVVRRDHGAGQVEPAGIWPVIGIRLDPCNVIRSENRMR